MPVCTIGWRAARALRPVLLALILLAPPAAEAQYFGRNKVVYRRFDFRVLRTPHYDVHYYPEEAAAVRDAGRMAERWYARHRATFDDTLGRRSLILYASPGDFQQTNVIPSDIGEGTGGVTEGYRSRVTMPLTGVYAETDHVLGHELVHVYQYAAAQAPTEQGGGGSVSSIGTLPLWLVEGMAEYLSVGRNDPHTAMWMRSAVLRDKVPKYKDLTDPNIFPYRYGQALCAYIGGRWGDDVLVDLFLEGLRRPLEDAIQRQLQLSPDRLVAEWTEAMRALYGPAMAGRTDPRNAGVAILAERGREPGLDVAPVASPDGRYVAFYSSRSLFSIDIFIADVATGEVVSRLTSSTGTSHFDALSFVYNAGTWSPDGRDFAFVTYREGRNELAIANVARRDITRRITIPGVSGIASPTWSPDGHTIAFSGQAGGVSDLYSYDLRTGSVQRLTSDPYADIQPAWSPDGRTIAFVTDRGEGTDLAMLTYAPLGVAIIDVATRAIRPVPLFAGVNALNPQWTPDSRSLYFLSTPDGFSDIYRVDLASGQRARVTRTATGVSGIAALSPALSVATETGRLFFSVFDRTGYRLLALDSARARGEPIGEPVAEQAAGPAAPGLLAPPEATATSAVERRVHDPVTGLVSAATFEERSYAPTLKLDAISPLSAGVSTSRYGTGFVGGISASWSDELGNKNLGVAMQAIGEVQDIGAAAYYLDLKRRWQRYYGLSHVPYLTVYTTVGPGTVNVPGGGSTNATIVNQYLQRVFFDQAQVGTMYPFSPVRRLEFSAGVSRVGFSTEVRRLAVIGSGVYDLGRDDVESPGSLTFAQGAAALVFDNSMFGFTSPVTGGRYRLEFAPAYGDLTYNLLTVDYRRYLFAKPFTLAFRGLTVGRYGKDSESDRLSPLWVGDGSLVRGYSVFSFDPVECTQGVSGSSSCPEFDRMIGSRIGAANLELRIPLFGTRELGLFRTRFLPIEISPFVDAGVAWTQESSPEWVFERESTARIPIVSAGVSSRFNLFGAMVLEVFYAKPFQRATKGWVWGVQLLPGW